jgi:hypothetical protein
LEDVESIKLFIDESNLDQEYGGQLKIEDVGRIILLSGH